jgi:hypothetical protein
MRHRLIPLLVLLCAVPAIAAEPAPSFERDIAPLIREHCVKCHSGKSPKGDLDLSSAQGLSAGGANGNAVEPGKAAASLLFKHVRDKKMPPKAPLAAEQVAMLGRWIDAGAKWDGSSLTVAKSEEKRAGLDWWSLQPIRRPAVPTAGASPAARPINPVDAFILAKLQAKGLTFSREADRRTYIRRVTVDLTGLLPTPEEVTAFECDPSPLAYEKLVDRLLASSAYGERWARHWLDVVRFAESHGYEMNTLRPNAWPYRDYVIRAFNEDLPFARLVKDQLAADATGGEGAATGFLVAGPHDLVGNQTLEGTLQQRADDLADIVSTTSLTFLGLTVGCARCHDHKFDPISQRDFYAMQAVFAGIDHAERPLPQSDDGKRRHQIEQVRTELAKVEREMEKHEPIAVSVWPAHVQQLRAPVQPGRNVERVEPVEAKFIRMTITATFDGIQPCIDELEVFGPDDPTANLALAKRGAKATASSEYPNVAIHKIIHLNDGQYGNGRSWISAENGKGWCQVELPKPETIDRLVWGRDREGKFRDRLAKDYKIEVSLGGRTWQPVAGSWDRQPLTPPADASLPRIAPNGALLEQLNQLRRRLRDLETVPTAYCGAFRNPDKTHLLKRGDPMQKLDEVAPSAVAAVKPAFTLKSGATEPQRRVALADWIAHPDNPLPARVLVNRLWHGHFGQGIVNTPSDFGFNGGRPSHQELLDWLAAEFLANGGHAKPIHRLIVLSQTYRQAGDSNPAAVAVDTGNRLLWRMTPHRLEAEALRDAMLQVSGALDRRMAGPGYHLWDYSGYVIVFTPKAKLGPPEFRRMVYQFKPRLQQDGTFGAFDCPDATGSMPRRNVSTTPLQALNLLNDPFVLDQCDRFAARLKREVGEDARAQVVRAFRLAFGREPMAGETAAAIELVRRHGLAALARALFNANEFVFVD